MFFIPMATFDEDESALVFDDAEETYPAIANIRRFYEDDDTIERYGYENVSSMINHILIYQVFDDPFDYESFAIYHMNRVSDEFIERRVKIPLHDLIEHIRRNHGSGFGGKELPPSVVQNLFFTTVYLNSRLMSEERSFADFLLIMIDEIVQNQFFPGVSKFLSTCLNEQYLGEHVAHNWFSIIGRNMRTGNDVSHIDEFVYAMRHYTDCTKVPVYKNINEVLSYLILTNDERTLGIWFSCIDTCSFLLAHVPNHSLFFTTEFYHTLIEDIRFVAPLLDKCMSDKFSIHYQES